MDALNALPTAELIAALDLQAMFGADALIAPGTGEMYVQDRLAAQEARSGHRHVPVEMPMAAPKRARAEDAPDVERLAREAATIEAAIEAVSRHRKLRALVRTAYRALAPVIIENSRVLVVAEAPTDEEERAGELWAGAEGAYFKQMLRSIDVDPATVSRMVLSPWRAPGGRPLNPEESKAVRLVMERVLALTGITDVLTIGTPSARIVLQSDVEGGEPFKLASVRGKWQGLPQVPAARAGRENVRVFALQCLKQVMRSASVKRSAWHELQLLRDSWRDLGDGPR